MNEFRITRSKDIGLYINDEQLFGVTEFRARSEYGRYPIYEYLSGEPHAVVNSKNTYELHLTVLSLFHYAVTQESGFTLSVTDGDTVYRYDGCTVVSSSRGVKAGKYVVDEFVIAATAMRKQVQEHAG